MKAFKIILTVLVSLAITATMAVAFVNNSTQNNSGRYSSVTNVIDTEREWILERFGAEYNSIEEYIATVQGYARQNFKYDYDKKFIFQYFDFANIVNGDQINGICFDFAVLFKHITLVLDEEGLLPESNIKVYVTDVRYKKSFMSAHSYNVISLSNGDNYFVDLTVTVSRCEKGLKPAPDYEVFKGTIKNYAKQYNEILYNLH